MLPQNGLKEIKGDSEKHKAMFLKWNRGLFVLSCACRRHACSPADNYADIHSCVSMQINLTCPGCVQTRPSWKSVPHWPTSLSITSLVINCGFKSHCECIRRWQYTAAKRWLWLPTHWGTRPLNMSNTSYICTSTNTTLAFAWFHL